MPWRTDGRIALSFALMLLVLLINAFFSQRALEGLRTNQGVVVHSWEIRAVLGDLKAQLEKADAALRGNLLSGDSTFVTAFQEASQDADRDLDRLQRLTRGDPTQLQHMTQLRQAIQERRAFALDSMERRRLLGSRWKLSESRTQLARRLIAQLRDALLRMEEVETSLLEDRLRKASENEHQTRITFFGATAMATVALFTTFLLLQRVLRERLQSEQAIRQRQSEIQDLNQRLQRAVAESHHRIKNNLQVLVALVDTMRLGESVASHPAALERLARHIRGLATLHDLLTEQTKTPGAALDTVSARLVLERLVPALEVLIGPRQIVLEVQEVALSHKQVSSLALITNELVSNAIKHGQGTITVRLYTEAARVQLEVQDQGPGFALGFNPHTASSTGLSLIESIGGWDLAGEVTYESLPEGARVRVSFPAFEASLHKPEG